MAKKQCTNCGAFAGPRTKICGQCNTPFKIKGGFASISDDYLANDSVEFDSEIHFETRIRKCALCEYEYSADSKNKDCYGNTVYIFNNGLYCSKFCLRQASNIIGTAAIKLKRGTALNEEETSLLKHIEDRESEIKEFESHLKEYPVVKFRIRPEKSLPFTTREELETNGLKMPIRSDYQPKVETDDDDDSGLVGFSGLVEAELEEVEEKEEPKPEIASGFGALTVEKPAVSGFGALTVEKPASGFGALTSSAVSKPTVINPQQKDPGKGPGRKQCKNCKFHIGVRSHTCKFCGHSC